MLAFCSLYVLKGIRSKDYVYESADGRNGQS